ncbi:beta-galactosidase [Niabella drilacis]|uniref:Beta-galactosidase n=1 Tax=Niabella drilacis (strain DSM 25811 / CCM 8410 / CCUG 62505 / LMG 26954 / E90) TaxID=1285928 RepID=A0A1G6R271_NIADE|nr:beta-galactosidase [Niabella drilacis]SDC98611.1 Glycosyl hydrolases family 35 [Niabella drilacis]
MKKYFLFAQLFLFLSAGVLYGQAQVYEIDASETVTKAPQSIPFSGTDPQGVSLAATNRYFLKNGRPWFPLMGEMHYNRVPPQDWESGILKMKNAGLSIVATYIFWNEHETAPGVWDWKGNRDLRKFVELCAKHQMYVWLRIGPWAHGEQLHGGHPEWIAKMPGKRSNDPAYIAAAATLFGQIGAQAKGLFFKEGGPVIGIQLENEYAGGQAAHISKLKEMALASGMHPVFWSVTANTVFDQEKMEVIPLQGSYCYRGWEKGGGGPTADFLYGDDQWIMTDALGKLYYDMNRFPRGLCEQGAGSQMTYQNRFVVAPEVEEAHLQNQLGRGMNMIGYYMFHGGTQTPGLKEPGLPESYDFQAPVGEFGIIRPSYKYLKVLHCFINDFGSLLAAMPQVEPANPVRDVHNTRNLRYIVRVKDNSGFLFLNNTQVRIPMPDRDITVAVKLKGETIHYPSVFLKGQTNLLLPFNLKVNDVLIKYATAQPLAKIEDGTATTLFFMKPEGVNPVIAIDAATLKTKKSAGPEIRKLEPGVPLRLTGKTGKRLVIITLTRREAENSWRTTVKGKEVLVITGADLISDGRHIQLQQAGSNRFHFKIYPESVASMVAGGVVTAGKRGLFAAYGITVPAYKPGIRVDIQKGNATIQLPESLPRQVNDVWLKIKYAGGSAVARRDGMVLTDHVFNGEPWLLGTKNYSGGGAVQLTVQEWKEDITGVDPDRVQDIKAKGAVIEKVEVVPQYKVDIGL